MTPKTSKNKAETARIAADFERFWALYPRGDKKKPARELWTRLQPSSALVETILEAVEAQSRREDWRAEQGKYVPHASTWLRQERWTDRVRVDAPRPATVFTCPHDPPCLGRHACHIKTVLEAARK